MSILSLDRQRPSPNSLRRSAIHISYEHVSNCLDYYFQTEACSGRHYSIDERVILIICRLHLQWRDAMKIPVEVLFLVWVFTKNSQRVVSGGSRVLVLVSFQEGMAWPSGELNPLVSILRY
jgi:hypothetical protein